MGSLQWKIFALLIIASFVRTGFGTCIYDDSSSGKCSDPALQPVVNTQAETYGPGSRCVETGTWVRMEGGTLTSSDPSLQNGCYQYSCSRDNGVTITVLGNSFQCSRKNEVLDIDITVDGVKYQGSLICPSCAEICYDELFNCPDVLSVELNFDQRVYRVSEVAGSKNLALYVCLTANSTDRPFAATFTPLSGTALAGEDFIAVSEEIEFEVGNDVRGCGCVGIIEDSSVEALETFEVNVAVPDELVEVSGQTVATVELVDGDGKMDTRLYFTNYSPRVDGNSVSADFVVGNSFTSVLCQITTRTTPIDCSRGSVEYRDLNPDNSEEYQLKVTGTLPDGSTEELVRSVHLDTISDCWVHFVNNGTTVNGNTIKFEWEGTGPAALSSHDLPFQCRLDGIDQFIECTSPYTVTSSIPLEDGEYTFIIRYDPNREECKGKRTTYISFEINRQN